MNNLDQFDKSGYIIWPDMLSNKELKSFRHEYDNLNQEANFILNQTQKHKISLNNFYQYNLDSLIVVPEKNNPLQTCRFEFVAKNSDFINQYIVPKLSKIINELTGDDYLLFKDKCNLKLPGGGAFSPHQDIIAYQYFKPTFHITAAMMLEDSTLGNGCLQIVKNYLDLTTDKTRYVNTIQGKLPLFPCYDHNGEMNTRTLSSISWEAIEAKAGSIILFNSYVPHFSETNQSTNSRINFFFTFNNVKEGEHYESYYHKKRNEFNNPMFHVATPTV